jgi:hypothetical protein
MGHCWKPEVQLSSVQPNATLLLMLMVKIVTLLLLLSLLFLAEQPRL